MGADYSKLADISDEDISSLYEGDNKTHFTKRQVQALKSKYLEILRQITRVEDMEAMFIKALNIESIRLGSVIYKMMNEKGDDKLTFSEFVRGLDVFNESYDRMEKINKCMDAFDADNSKTISIDEIINILEMSLEGNPFLTFSRPQIEHVIHATYDHCQIPYDSELDSAEFRRLVDYCPAIIQCFDIDVTNLIG